MLPGREYRYRGAFRVAFREQRLSLWYAKASAPDSVVQVPCQSVYKPITFRANDVNYYKYTAAISSLEPGTDYIYYVKSGAARSATQKFRTAGLSGSYNFL